MTRLLLPPVCCMYGTQKDQGEWAKHFKPPFSDPKSLALVGGPFAVPLHVGLLHLQGRVHAPLVELHPVRQGTLLVGCMWRAPPRS